MSLPTKAADRKATPIATGVLDYFPDAIAEVARVSKAGNDQHNPGQPLHWAKNKSTDHADCIARHLLERGTIDTDGQRHSAKVAWRALALLQVELDAAAEKEFYEDPAEQWTDLAPVIQSVEVYDSNPVPEPNNIVVSFAGNEVPLVDILEAVIQNSPNSTFRDTARDLQLQMKEIVEENKSKELACDIANFTPILFEAPLPSWPDSEGIWGYVVNHTQLASFRYLVDGEKDSDGYYVLKPIDDGTRAFKHGVRIFRSGSDTNPDFDEVNFSDSPSNTWAKLADLPAEPVQGAHAATDAAFDDGVSYADDDAFEGSEAASPTAGGYDPSIWDIYTPDEISFVYNNIDHNPEKTASWSRATQGLHRRARAHREEFLRDAIPRAFQN